MIRPSQNPHLYRRAVGAAVGALAALLAVAVAAHPARAMVPSDLCTGNPCIVSGTISLDGSFFDFGDTTDLRFASDANVRVKGDYFRAGTITLDVPAQVLSRARTHGEL